MITQEKVTVVYKGQPYALAVNKLLRSDDYIFFLHGLGCAKESFDGAFEFDGFKNFSLVSFDFLGFGESEKPDDFSYDLESQADVAALLIESFAPTRLFIVAHSMGGAISVLLTEKLQEFDVKSLVNIEGNLAAEDCGIVSRGLANQSFEEFSATGSVNFLRDLVSSSRPDLRAWAEWYEQASLKALHQSSKSLVKWSDSGELLQIFNELPSKSYIYGDEDPKSFLLPKIEKTDIRCIKGAGHFVMVDEPAELYKNIASILTEV